MSPDAVPRRGDFAPLGCDFRTPGARIAVGSRSMRARPALYGPCGRARAVAKQELSVTKELRAGIPIPAPVIRRRPAPRPGDRLRRAVDAALAELAATATPDDPTRH